jgi:hypothetical protein
MVTSQLITRRVSQNDDMIILYVLVLVVINQHEIASSNLYNHINNWVIQNMHYRIGAVRARAAMSDGTIRSIYRSTKSCVSGILYHA